MTTLLDEHCTGLKCLENPDFCLPDNTGSRGRHFEWISYGHSDYSQASENTMITIPHRAARAGTPPYLFMLALMAIGAATRPALAAPPVSLESLLREMVDRDQLARFPDPAYVCRQFSSYDRETVAPDQPGWFANWDRSQFVRVEENEGRREHVLMDAAGPGAVVRFWATWHGPGGGPFSNGTMRVYLDNEPKPAIAGPMADLISGGALVGAPFSESVSPETAYARRGHNLYLPIPYAKHCKITYHTDQPIDVGGKKGEALYYQINYRTYEPGTDVVSFRKEQLQRHQALLSECGERLLRGGLEGGDHAEGVNGSSPLSPGGKRIIELTGPAAVRQFTVKLDADDLEQTLRSTVLEIEFDGNRTVWCPVGDFFGTGYRIAAYRSWHTQVTDDGTMTAFWVMPFEQSCTITIHNLGQQEVGLTTSVSSTEGWDWDDRALHFHATWRQYTKIDTGPNKDMTGRGAFDVNYVEIAGRGQFVGDTLTLFNGTSAWWGEGDEKIYIDGEATPSHIGTGTEDYYGYAWCRPEYFQSPFHAQPCGTGNMAGGFSVNSRYRILDALPFTTSLKFDMEMWHWRATKMNYAPATFWYARPGAKCNVQPDPEAAALPVARKRSDIVEILRVPGAIEGEALRIVEKTGGETEIQDVAQFRWSGDQQLWWRDAKPDDRLVLEVPVEQAGTYQVAAGLTKANDYGIVRMKVNGQASETPLDRFHTSVQHDLIDLGRFELKAGANRLEVEIVGANDQAIKRYMFGLDYVKLTKAE